MWRVTIECSAEDWQISGTSFKDIAAKYPTTLLSSKKMHGDERRIMEYQIEDVSDAEEFTEECMTLSGFMAIFESL
jgi:cytochrome c551/c552